MVPNGWKKGLLDEGIELISGQHVEANCVNNLGVGIPYLTGPADFPNGKIVVTKFTNEGKKFSKKGDLLITVKGSGTGKVIESDNEYAISRQLMAIRPKTFDSKFVYYNLVSSLGRYEDAAAGLIPGISREDVLHTPLLIPPIDEQMAIAQILSTWDQAISTTEKLLENSQQQKKALMQQLLTGKKRLLDENGVRFSGEWKKVKFSALGKCIRGVSYKPEDICLERSESTVRLLRSTNIQNGILNNQELVILPKKLIKPNQYLQDGDLAICMANGSKTLVGKSAIYSETKELYTVGAFCAIFRPLNVSNKIFVKFVFESESYKQQISVILAGSSINNLKGSDIESLQISIPTEIKEREEIANVLLIADQEIEILQKKLDCLKQEKKALMQQLLTGKKRVKVAA
ncbi:MAG: restriction endonuclease subunit S [Acinetobacter radioresistens]